MTPLWPIGYSYRTSKEKENSGDLHSNCTRPYNYRLEKNKSTAKHVHPDMYCTTEDEIMDWIKRGVKTQNNNKKRIEIQPEKINRKQDPTNKTLIIIIISLECATQSHGKKWRKGMRNGVVAHHGTSGIGNRVEIRGRVPCCSPFARINP